MIKKYLRFVLILPSVLSVFLSLGQDILRAEPDQRDAAASQRTLKTNVAMLAVPVAVRTPEAGRAVDALEKPAEEMGPDWKVVVFSIERVVSGDFKKITIPDLSLMSQMKDAAKEKNVLKLVTMDFERPAEEPVEKGTLSIAVSDPYATFGIREGEKIPKQRYRISLARVSKKPESYVVTKIEKR